MGTISGQAKTEELPSRKGAGEEKRPSLFQKHIRSDKCSLKKIYSAPWGGEDSNKDEILRRDSRWGPCTNTGGGGIEDGD